MVRLSLCSIHKCLNVDLIALNFFFKSTSHRHPLKIRMKFILSLTKKKCYTGPDIFFSNKIKRFTLVLDHGLCRGYIGFANFDIIIDLEGEACI